MHNEFAASCGVQLADKIRHHRGRLIPIQANAVLHRNRHIDRVLHGLDAIGHQSGLGHQTSTKGPSLHALRRAAAIQIDLAIAPTLTPLGGLGQIGRLTAADLQGQRMFRRVMVQVPGHIAMQQSACGHHLGVQPSMAGDQAMEITAMPVRPIHHRRHRQGEGLGHGHVFKPWRHQHQPMCRPPLTEKSAPVE